MPPVRVRRHAREIVTDRRPPMAKRITRDDATPILDELQRIENDAVVYSELVGSDAKRGHSEKDLDIMVAIDPSRVGVKVHDLDEFYDWLGSEEGSGLEVVRAIHNAMERAGATFHPGSDPDPESWILVRRKRSVPVDLWYTWSTPEMEKAGEEELRRLKEMIERG